MRNDSSYRYDILVTQLPVWSRDCCSVPRSFIEPSWAWPRRYRGFPKLKLTSASAQPSLFFSLIPRGLCIWDGVKRLPYVSKFSSSILQSGGLEGTKCVLLLHSHSDKSPTSGANCCSKFRVKIPGIWPKGRTLKSSREKGRWQGRREFQESWKREQERFGTIHKWRPPRTEGFFGLIVLMRGNVKCEWEGLKKARQFCGCHLWKVPYDESFLIILLLR